MNQQNIHARAQVQPNTRYKIKNLPFGQGMDQAILQLPGPEWGTYISVTARISMLYQLHCTGHKRQTSINLI